MKILYNIKKLFLIFSVSFVALAAAGEKSNPSKYVKTNRSAGPRYADRILFVEDENKKEFVVKRHADPEEAIHETVCAEILENMGIKTNHVEIFPTDCSPISEFDSFVTTVHSFVPGREVGDIPAMRDFDIQDGLASERTLRNMVQYGCADIVAVNTYLNDWDSHTYNNLFDEKTNQLYTIDKGQAFARLRRISNDSCASSRQPLSTYLFATQSHRHLATLNNKKKLSLPEIKALKSVKNKLLDIMMEYPATRLHTKWIETAEKVHYEYAPEKQEYMLEIFEYNFKENGKVVMQLHKLTKPSHKLSLNNFRCVLQGIVKGLQPKFFSSINS